jgi:hypothetical protein
MEPCAQILCDLPDEEAAALAQFLKRVSLSDFRPLAYDIEEAYAMQAAAERLRTALALAGYLPR